MVEVFTKYFICFGELFVKLKILNICQKRIFQIGLGDILSPFYNMPIASDRFLSFMYILYKSLINSWDVKLAVAVTAGLTFLPHLLSTAIVLFSMYTKELTVCYSPYSVLMFL